MTILNRETLKNFFRTGRFPKEVHFSALIDSSINKVDDGFNKSEEHGLEIAPQGNSNELISFFENIEDDKARWQFELRKEEKLKGLSLNRIEKDEEGLSVKKTQLFFGIDGKIGINTTQPRHSLDVNGTVAARNRVGSWKAKEGAQDGGTPIVGNGQWHRITHDLTGSNAFEVVARIKTPGGKKKNAMIHAIAINVNGRGKIKRTSVHSGWFRNALVLRWSGNKDKYYLEVRSRSHYGIYPTTGVPKITYHITSLWEDGTSEE